MLRVSTTAIAILATSCACLLVGCSGQDAQRDSASNDQAVSATMHDNQVLLEADTSLGNGPAFVSNLGYTPDPSRVWATDGQAPAGGIQPPAVLCVDGSAGGCTKLSITLRSGREASTEMATVFLNQTESNVTRAYQTTVGSYTTPAELNLAFCGSLTVDTVDMDGRKPGPSMTHDVCFGQGSFSNLGTPNNNWWVGSKEAKWTSNNGPDSAGYGLLDFSSDGLDIGSLTDYPTEEGGEKSSDQNLEFLVGMNLPDTTAKRRPIHG